MENEIGKKIEKEKNEKVQEIKFEDLPKKIQKEILRRKFFADIKPVKPKEIEEGTLKILQILKISPKPMTRLELVERTGFNKKKVKRILNELDGFMVKKITSFKVTTYRYVGKNLIK